jgi:polar amino acid transport system permease protein
MSAGVAQAPGWPGPDSGAEEIVDPPRYGRWVAVAGVGIGVVWVVWQLWTNPGFQWDIVFRYLFDWTVLRGVGMTLQLTILVMLIGAVIGVVVAVMRMSKDPLLNMCAHGFVWFFRGTPVLVQLVFWYNLAALFPTIALGIPFGGPKLFEVSSTVAISSFTAAMLGLGLNEGAYMAEIIRAGLLSVDNGQTEASKALGHTPWQTFRVVVLPQAMKAIVPPTGNQLIGMLKYTSIASVVALHELMHSVETIYKVSVLSVIQHRIERYYLRGWQAEVLLSQQQP